jgi:hypothetical protein
VTSRICLSVRQMANLPPHGDEAAIVTGEGNWTAGEREPEGETAVMRPSEVRTKAPPEGKRVSWEMGGGRGEG